MKIVLDDAGMRAALISQVLDIFPKMDVELKENTVRILDDDKLLIGFTGEDKVREALVSGFLAGIVKGFGIAMQAVPNTTRSDN